AAPPRAAELARALFELEQLLALLLDDHQAERVAEQADVGPERIGVCRHGLSIRPASFTMQPPCGRATTGAQRRSPSTSTQSRAGAARSSWLRRARSRAATTTSAPRCRVSMGCSTGTS